MAASANADSQRKKKAAFPHKGRSKLVRIVFLDTNTGMIPRGAAREKLRSGDRIKDIPFFRYLTANEVRSLIRESFSISCEYNYLKGQKDNSLLCVDKQDLDGAEVIELAGHGSVYLEQRRESREHHESEECERSPPQDTTSTSNVSNDEVLQEREASDERKKLIEKADEMIEKLRVCMFVTPFPALIMMFNDTRQQSLKGILYLIVCLTRMLNLLMK